MFVYHYAIGTSAVHFFIRPHSLQRGEVGGGVDDKFVFLFSTLKMLDLYVMFMHKEIQLNH